MQSEVNLQAKCIMWFRNTYCRIGCEPKCVIFSVPNENNYHKINSGVLAGVSDVIAVMPNRVIFFEFKTEIGKQSEKQKHFQKDIKALGYEYYIIRSESEFIQYFNPDIQKFSNLEQNPF